MAANNKPIRLGLDPEKNDRLRLVAKLEGTTAVLLLRAVVDKLIESHLGKIEAIEEKYQAAEDLAKQTQSARAQGKHEQVKALAEQAERAWEMAGQALRELELC